MEAKDPLSEEVKIQILTAAAERFCVYGYGKTTMAEIAKDCHMSAANLYRFFKNKLDIGAELANSNLNDKLQRLKQVVSRQNISCSERLRMFVLTAFEHTYDLADKPRINELVSTICDERHDIIEHHIKDKQFLLTQLLTEAKARGEFPGIGEPSVYADTILCTTKMFELPMLMGMYDKDIFIDKVNNVVDLLLSGLKKG